MGHSNVTIIVRNATTPAEAEEKAAVLMSDYDDTSPGGKWEWYTVGESELGFYAVKAGVDASKHSLGEDPVFGDEPAGLLHRSANIAQKGSIDFEATRTLREDEGLATRSLLTEGGWVEQEQEQAEEEWAEQFNKALNATPDDAWLVMADFHC